MVKTTVLSLLVEINALDSKVNHLKTAIRANVFHKEIVEIASNFDFSQTDAERLSFQISERDWPMTQKEIKDVFETSGFEYSQNDIEASKPDSDEVYQNWIDEERRNEY